MYVCSWEDKVPRNNSPEKYAMTFDIPLRVRMGKRYAWGRKIRKSVVRGFFLFQVAASCGLPLSAPRCKLDLDFAKFPSFSFFIYAHLKVCSKLKEKIKIEVLR